MTPTIPFKGVLADRPYANPLLTDLQWAEVGVEQVHFNRLWLTNRQVPIRRLFVPDYDLDLYPHVIVADDGLMYLDGDHTRVVSTVLKTSARFAPMRVLRRAGP